MISCTGCYTQLGGVRSDAALYESGARTSAVATNASLDEGSDSNDLVITPDALVYVLEPPYYVPPPDYGYPGTWYQPPVQVTFTIRNRGSEPIFIEGSSEGAARFVERKVLTDWVPFAEDRLSLDRHMPSIGVPPGTSVVATVDFTEPGAYRVGVHTLADGIQSDRLVYTDEINVISR